MISIQNEFRSSPLILVTVESIVLPFESEVPNRKGFTNSRELLEGIQDEFNL